MTGQMKGAMWWTCCECNAQVATHALVFAPLDDPIIASRKHFYKGMKGEVWETALLVDSYGLRIEKPKYCPNCGGKVVS